MDISAIKGNGRTPFASQASDADTVAFPSPAGSMKDGWDTVSAYSVRSLDSNGLIFAPPANHQEFTKALSDLPVPDATRIMSWDDGNKSGGAATAADDPWGASAGPDGFSAAPANDTGGGGDYGNDRAEHNNDQYDRFDGGGGGGDDRACFGCGQPGHNKADCPNKTPVNCNHCGKEGHIRRECPDAPPMVCKICGDPDHMRKDCPQKPAEICLNCQQEGHEVTECKNPRKIDYSAVPDLPIDVAWNAVRAAIQERDSIEVKAALMAYLKHNPEVPYIEIEEGFRRQRLNAYIIALERDVLPTMTLMDLQGNLGKKYCVSFRFSDKASRPREYSAWPKSREENIERLADAGEPVQNFEPRCYNCGQMGHTSRACQVEKTHVATVVHCYNCDEDGHRVRDCPAPRKDRFACRNCGQSGHKATDCTEPRNADNVECNKCHEMGHFSRDCPQGGGGRACHNCGNEGHMSRECPEPRKLICRNCDEEGHLSRDCPKPVDVSRIKCNNCGQMGHKQYQCTIAPKEEEHGNDDASNAGGFDTGNRSAPADDGGW